MAITTVLAIGASDPAGERGIQADMRGVALAEGCGTFVLTAFMDPFGETFRISEQVSGKTLRAQFHALDGHPLAAIKMGLIPGEDHVAIIAAELRNRPGVPVVAAPVIPRPAGGFRLSSRALLGFCDQLLPLTTVLVVGSEAAADLLGEGREAADLVAGLREMGPQWVILSNRPAAEGRQDLLSDGTRWYAVTNAAVEAVPGDDALYAAALATALGSGMGVPAAASAAREIAIRSRRHG
ncbi:MAG: bifunctional hydroxymethylpyrimidine kinase/phosphomethylpyrimidine kinase [Candidatus Dormibacteria bacterium]